MPNAIFDEIRNTLRFLPECDAAIAEAAASRLQARAGAEPSPIARIAAWLAGVQRRPSPRIIRPRVAIFAATHGIAADLPFGGADAVAAEIASMLSGDGEAHRLIEGIGGELKLYELAVEQPTRDSRVEAAMNEAEAALATFYGMTSVEEGVDVLVIAALGRGGDLAASAVDAALFPEAAPRADECAARVVAALTRHRATTDPLDVLAALGGPDIAAMLGAIVAARYAGVPVILDGPAAHAAASVAVRLRPDALDHCRSATNRPRGMAISSSLPLESILQDAFETPLGGINAVSVLEDACRLLD